MEMFNSDDIDTLLTKRKQKFVGLFARMDRIRNERAAANSRGIKMFSAVARAILSQLIDINVDLAWNTLTAL